MGGPLGVLYTPANKNEIEKRIVDAKDANLEERFLMTIYSLRAYVQSLFKFGVKSEATREALKVRKEFIRIIKEENALFDFLLTNMGIVDADKAQEIVDMLDDLNDLTVTYYYDVLDNIEDAVELSDERRAKRSPKSFDTLIESKSYRQEIMALVENTRTIAEFLGYPEEFWVFMRDKYRTVEMSHEIADGMPKVMKIYDENGNIVDLRLICPEPNDLYTALVALQKWAEAYEVYKSIGKRAALWDVNSIEEKKQEYTEHLTHKSGKAIR